MMEILGLTNFDQIRGVLAVSPVDLPDEILIPYALEDDLEVEVSSWLPDWQAVRDTGESRNQQLLRLFAKYYCASVAAIAGQNFMLKKFTDGEVEGQRSDAEGYQQLREHLAEKARHYRGRLLDALTPNAEEPGFVPAIGRVVPTRSVIDEGRG